MKTKNRLCVLLILGLLSLLLCSCQSKPNVIVVEETYQKAVNMTTNDLTKKGSDWYYPGIPGKLLSEDTKSIGSPLNKDGHINQGAVYRKMAKVLEGFSVGLNDYKDYSELLLGFTPKTRDEFVPYAENAKRFITSEKSLFNVMKAFELLKCVDGSFDYNKNTLGVYDFTISDVSKCAKELQISEEMLGFILGMLDEYAPTITFDKNSCHVVYESMKKKIEPISSEDSIAELPSKSKSEKQESFSAEGKTTLMPFLENASANGFEITNPKRVDDEVTATAKGNDDSFKIIYVVRDQRVYSVSIFPNDSIQSPSYQDCVSAMAQSLNPNISASSVQDAMTRIIYGNERNIIVEETEFRYNDQAIIISY